MQLEEDARLELRGKEAGSLNIFISSEEILQSYFGTGLIKKIEKHYPQARIQFLIRSDEQAIEQVMNGEAHFAFITSEVPVKLTSKIVAKVEFKTTASKSHPLYAYLHVSTSFNKLSASGSIGSFFSFSLQENRETDKIALGRQ